MENTKTHLEYYGLAEAKDIQLLDYTNDEDWLEIRRKGIGGSDIGSIMGINKYSSPLQVYKAKVDGVTKDMSDNPFIKKGKDLEALIRNVYVTPYMASYHEGYEVRTLNHMLINNAAPWIRANLDGIAVPKEYDGNRKKLIVIEIKWVSEYAADNWYTEEYCNVPASYYAQVQAYMATVGADMAIVCALFDKDWKMHYFEVPRDELFISKMLRQTKEFYEYNMMMRIPPKFTAEIDKEDIIHKLKEPAVEPVDCPELDEVCVAYKEVSAELKELTAKKSALLDVITNAYLEGKRPTTPVIKVSLSSYTTSRIDTARLKAEQPDLVKQYTVTTECLRTTVK